MKIVKSLLALVATAGLVVAAPGAASAAPDEAPPRTGAVASVAPQQVGVNHTTSCPTGWVVSDANNLPVRTSPSTTASLIEWGQSGWLYECYPNTYYLGDRYTACGVTNANGWIAVWVPGTGWGFTYMTCLDDY
ncbi:hypothetical protein [Micromonospora sp. NPDC023956]|uniref:hypothetical protein n=1 Tax=Micromonospora sp. NPDC023956 TaxID=3155722 RepID=UPI0033C37F24